jgi:hypothetical protein
LERSTTSILICNPPLYLEQPSLEHTEQSRLLMLLREIFWVTQMLLTVEGHLVSWDEHIHSGEHIAVDVVALWKEHLYPV